MDTSQKERGKKTTGARNYVKQEYANTRLINDIETLYTQLVIKKLSPAHSQLEFE